MLLNENKSKKIKCLEFIYNLAYVLVVVVVSKSRML